jgi:hypothetical protein
MNVEILDGNPDGSIFATEFDKKIWEESKKLAPVLHNYVTVIKDRRFPSENWTASLIQAFASVAYKYKREYDRNDFLSWWRPMIIKENFMLDNFTKASYVYKFDRGIGGLRELREQGRVPDIIWKPWTVAHKYEHEPVGPIDQLKIIASKIPIYIIGGIAVYALAKGFAQKRL